jgi:hypothetical protein
MKNQSLAQRLALSCLLLPRKSIVRATTHDGFQTFDAAGMVAVNEFGDQRGRALDHAYRTHDGRTVDSTGAFLVGELERLDQTLHMPLVMVSYQRDIDMREDVSLADEVSSYTLSTFASAGNLGTGQGIRNSKAWIGKATDQIGGVAVDIGKIPNPLTPWGLEVKYSILELESAAKAGRPIDAQKYEALKMKHQMDIDEMVYVGDSSLGVGGLVNSASVTNVSNFPNGAAASTLWSTKTPAEILADVNALIQSTWAASAWKVMPNRLLLPPAQFGYISTQVVSTAGNQSILKYLLENNVLKASGAGELTIQPAKWLIGAGSGGTYGVSGTVDRCVIYTKEKQYVRYPMTLLQRTPVQYQSIFQMSTYYCRLGVVEVVYPETIGYRDGL